MGDVGLGSRDQDAKAVMGGDLNILELVQKVRSSASQKGRTYPDARLSAQWLANEIAEYCKTQGWEHTLCDAGSPDAWLVISDDVAALVEGVQGRVAFTVTDLNPVRLKSALVSSGLLALTGAGIVAFPLAGWAAWRARHRKNKVDAVVQFVDERVQANQPRADLQAPTSVASRLKDLEGLREQGLITDQEYKDKREQLLQQL